MFTARELKLILNALEDDCHNITAELVRRTELGKDITSLSIEHKELVALFDKVCDLFLEA